MKPPRIKKRVNVTIETIMEPDFERDDEEESPRNLRKKERDNRFATMSK